MLRSPNTYERATALAALETRAKTGDRASMLRAAYHADDRAGALTPLEAERIGATLRYWPDASSREAALTRLRALNAATSSEDAEVALAQACESAKETYGLAVRARAVLGGGGAGSYANLDAGPESSEHALARLGLDAIVALRRGRDGDAAAALMEACARAPRAEAIPAPLWSSALVALSAMSESVRREAGALAAALLEIARPPPPRGFVALACALERAGHADVAVRALRAAMVEGEATAKEALARALRMRGWSVAAVNRRAALEALREARALSHA